MFDENRQSKTFVNITRLATASMELEHIDEACQSVISRDPDCRKQHPRTCIFFDKNNTCKRSRYCLYSHSKNNSFNEFDNVGDGVKIL